MQKFEKTWESEIVEHKGFRDLGNYVIELPDITDPAIFERGRIVGNYVADHGGNYAKFGCTAMAKHNSKGEVIIGRNMDLDISQTPAYVFKTTTGKYKNVCVSYSPGFYLPYHEVQKLEELDPDMMAMVAGSACDCLNEKGLYIEVNLREYTKELECHGLHSARGEEFRADGTPWSELRACTTNVCQHVSQNCATVQEAVEYINNSFDWYTIVPAPGQAMAVSNNNLCCLIGDATGEYGVIEFGQDEVSYLPYQFGQANYYLTPKWNALETTGPGHGRLGMVSKVIQPVQTLEEAMDAMKPIMWRNETLWIGESHRITDGSHLHPYNQIAFEDNKGVPQMDWRTEYVFQWPVMDDGRMLYSSRLYKEAEESDYDPMIKQYIDEAVECGRMVIDDGSYKFAVNGEELTIDELAVRWFAYTASADLEERAALEPYWAEYWRLHRNLTSRWAVNDDNFEAMKAAAYASLHTRYDAEGNFDPKNSLSKYEKLCAFYGMGCEKDETPLRDDASVWTTSLNTGCNCAQKELKIRFWENDEVIFHAKF
ncbi:MAG: linear amide C-N hydrolase [Coriobacteriales bacterium]|nr:linear amide C-N hydrolase [Coriobacteriales bacterium]